MYKGYTNMNEQTNKRLGREFFDRDCVTVAKELVGKVLVCKTDEGEKRIRITETEAYHGETDTACHAYKGRTPRTEVLYGECGHAYIYLCYGIHNLMNVVCSEEGDPQCVLLRAGEDCTGPGRLTKALGVTGELNREDMVNSQTLWIEDDGKKFKYKAEKRVGINYANKKDIERKWRFVLEVRD